MRQRCRENARYYEDVEVCERWDKDFWAFVADVGDKPDDGQTWTLDRIDGSGNYEPGNVRWATYSQQNLNRTFSEREVPEFCKNGHRYEVVPDVGSGYRRCAQCVREHNRKRSIAWRDRNKQ